MLESNIPLKERNCFLCGSEVCKINGMYHNAHYKIIKVVKIGLRLQQLHLEHSWWSLLQNVTVSAMLFPAQ